MTWLRRHKHLLLVSTLGCFLVIQSTAHGTGGRAFSNAFLSLIFLAVLLVVFEHRRNRVVAVSLAVASIASNWASYVLSPGQIQVSASVVHYLVDIVFLGYAVAVILGDIFNKGTVAADDVLGAMSGYLIAGAAWSSLYALVDTFVPGSFTLTPALVAHPFDPEGRSAMFNYFSIVTLTTMGYGDITPARAPATSLAVLEAVFGQFYIAVVVAQLVGARMSGGVQRVPASTTSR
jgi:hypothetical protein